MSSVTGVDTGSYQGFALTASDTTVYAPPLAGVYIGASTTNTQNLAITHPDGTVTTYSNVLQGTILPVAASKVMSTNTTATSLVGLR
jgi:hypothetical protein